MWNSISSCISFFEKPLKDFPLWLRYLQTRIEVSCMYLSCQLSKTPHKTLKFQQTLLPLQTKKNIGKSDRTEVFSTDIHWKKNHVHQQCTSYASAVRNSVGNAFFGNLVTWISSIFHLLSTLGLPHGDWTKQTVKILNLWGKTVADRSAWIKACLHIIFLLMGNFLRCIHKLDIFHYVCQ